MVDMGVAEDQDIYFSRIEQKIQVSFVGFLPLALKQPALEQDFLSVGGNQHLRPGDGLSRAAELDSHVCTGGHGGSFWGFS
jgi:hypothetical protein